MIAGVPLFVITVKAEEERRWERGEDFGEIVKEGLVAEGGRRRERERERVSERRRMARKDDCRRLTVRGRGKGIVDKKNARFMITIISRIFNEGGGCEKGPEEHSC
jgi:hypothetical protein